MILQHRTLSSNDNSILAFAAQNGSKPAIVPSHPSEHSSVGANGLQINIIVWAMTAVATCFLSMRLCVKFRGRKSLWWDDHALIASWIMLLAYAGITSWCVHVGLGSHGNNNAPQSPLQMSVVIATVFSTLGAAWSKTSFAITLLRITRDGNRVVYWAVWCIIVTMNLVLIFNAIIGFIWCNPAPAAWNAEIESKCWDRRIVLHYAVFGAAYSAAMDFLLAMVPWLVIIKLRMQRKEKMGVLFCMSLGIFAGVTSIMRAITVPTLYSGDYTYEAGQLFIWTGAELATTIVAASIPILRALLSDIVKSSKSRRQEVTELNTFTTLKDEGGIRVTHTTTVTRSASKKVPERLSPSFAAHTDTENLLEESIPVSPGPTYHSYVQKY